MKVRIFFCLLVIVWDNVSFIKMSKNALSDIMARLRDHAGRPADCVATPADLAARLRDHAGRPADYAATRAELAESLQDIAERHSDNAREHSAEDYKIIIIKIF